MMQFRMRLFLASSSHNALCHRLAVQEPPVRFGYMLRDAYKELGLHHLDHLVRA